MAKVLVDARLLYLDNASKNLLKPSPAISAHLQSVRQSVIGERDEVSSPQTTERTCAACGNILIPGWSCESITETSTKRTRKDRREKKRGSMKIVNLRCHKCDVITSIESTKPGAKRRKPHQTQYPILNATAAPGTTKETSLDLTSVPEEIATRPSRKRPRGKKASLQSMLAKQKTAESSTASGFGLDLMDLMKP